MRDAHDARLALEWQNTADPVRREQIVTAFMPLVRALARGFARRGEPIEDLEQVAAVGLLAALQRFSLGRGPGFVAFAAPTITGELRRHYRDRSSSIRVPRATWELAKAVRVHAARHAEQHGRWPDAQELSDILDRPVEDIVDAVLADDARRPESLNRPIGSEGEDRELLSLLGDEDRRLLEAPERLAAVQLVAGLDPVNREIFLMRYLGELTQREIGARVGLSQMQVSRVLERILVQLRATVATADRQATLAAISAAR